MKILLCEDDESKRESISNFLETLLPSAEIRKASSVIDTVLFLKESRFDVLLLDIAIPIRPNSEIVVDGGLQVLQYLNNEGRGYAPLHIIATTAHDDLAEKYREKFGENFVFVVKYDPASDAWERAISGKLLSVLEAAHRVDESYDYDVAIVAALHEIELDALLQTPVEWKTEKRHGGDSIYYICTLNRPDGTPIRIVAAACQAMGIGPAVVTSLDLIREFRPKRIAMIGIAAGVSSDVAFGDVLIADSAYDYGSGKHLNSPDRGSIFMPAPQMIPIEASLYVQLRAFQRHHSNELTEIRTRWTEQAPIAAPKMKFGPIASGAAVVQAEQIVEGIKEHNRKVVGVDMETFGVFLAAHTSPRPRPAFFSMKSVCDFADAAKDDRYQRYAAYTSATTLLSFARWFF